LSSKSSSNPEPDLLPVGRVAGHRGRGGEVTVKAEGGNAGLWEGLRQVWIAPEGVAPRRPTRIESSHGYRDRLVLKLEGVDGSDAAAELRGQRVWAAVADAPELPDGEFYVARLIGLEVRDDSGSVLGRVADLIRTGGTDVLVVRAATSGGESDEDSKEGEWLLPLAKTIVVEVRADEGWLRVRPPAGLLELNRAD
jgi:16S rRNA processing protein RimM